MSQYHNFIGIDIGKFSFVVALSEKTKEYANTSEGIEAFVTDHQDVLPSSLCILETTGGYETDLLYTLHQGSFPAHRADTRKVKNFIRSFGHGAKTDKLDAKALAKYGAERGDSLPIFQPPSQQKALLFQLVQRREQLQHIQVSEKNRLQSPSTNLVKQSIKVVIETLSTQIDLLTAQIQKQIQGDTSLQKKYHVLKTVPGIGDIVGFELRVLLPELGQLNRRKIAALAGLAPLANESGKLKGYRRTGHGRSAIKPILVMAAMGAARSNSELGKFYDQLIVRGKKKMVALTVLMRKILVIANARIKEYLLAP